MSLTLAEATRIVEAAVAKAESIGVTLSVAVVDARGDLVALARMDGTGYITPTTARGKAQVSATLGGPSGDYSEVAGQPVYQTINQIGGGLMIFHQGAVPLFKDGRLVGAVGASGATAEEDEAVAIAGAATL